MFVAANSGKIVFLADMNGSGWNDYVRERASALTLDDSGILYYLNPGSQLLTRENKLGGPPQKVDMQVPVVDFKVDYANRILAVSTSQHCAVRINDFGGGGFVRFGTKGSDASQFNVLQFKRDTSSLEALNKPGSLAGPAAISVLRPAQAAGRIR